MVKNSDANLFDEAQAEAAAIVSALLPERVTPPLHKLSPSAPQMRRIVRHCNARRCPLCRRKAWDCRCG